MSDSGGLSLPRRSQEVVSLDQPADFLREQVLRRENSLPLASGSGVKSTHVVPLSLPIVHAAIATGKDAATPVFSPHSLLVTSYGLVLTSHATQEEIALPVTAIFDIFPVPQTEDLNAPTPHLLQLLSSAKRMSINGSKQTLELNEVSVTLSLPSTLDCTSLVAQLAAARLSADDNDHGSSPKSLAASHHSPLHPTSPPSPIQVPEERSSISSEGERSTGLQNEFLTLCCQVVGSGHGYMQCDLRLMAPGLVIEQTASAALNGNGKWLGPWCMPWSSLIEIRIADTALDFEQPPQSHPQAVRLSVAHRAGLVGSTSCMLNIAVDSHARTQSLLRALQAYQQQHFPPRSLQPPSGLAPNPGAVLTNGILGRGVVNAGPPSNRASVEVSSLGAPPGSKDGEQLHVVHINNTPVQLTPAMANLLMSYQPEDSKQPDNFQLSKAFILLPTVHSFQRCAILVDKLGLAVTPLVAIDRLQDRARTGARAVRDAGGVICEYALITEALHFPISALVDVSEEAELTLSNMPTLPPELMPQPASHNQTQPSSSSTSTASGATGPAASPASAAPASVPPSTGSSGSRRQLLPFARLSTRWEKPAEGEQGKEKNEKGKVPEPPYPHLVSVRVKVSFAGRVEKTPIHLRLNAQPPPPVAVVFSFASKDDALGFVSSILAFKKYHLSLALSTYLNTLTAVSQRQAERRGNRPTEEGVVAQRMMGQASVPSVEPPPLPPRPADLPQANRLPRMVTNDEGEVFWYIPRKQAAKQPGTNAGGASASGVAPAMLPVPQPDSDVNPPPPEPSPRLGQAAAGPSAVAAPSPQTASSGAAEPGNPGKLDAGGPIQTPPSIQTPPRSTGSILDGGSRVGVSIPVPVSPPAITAAAIFDDDLGVVDTPAPCLASPTPTPGRRAV